MKDRQRVWLWLSTAVSLIVGFILAWNDSGAGWFLILMAFTYLGLSTRAGQSWAASNPELSNWGLVNVTLLLVLLAGVAGTVMLLR